MANNNYLLDNSQNEAGARLDAISLLFDENSFQHMRQLGLSQRWRCWEVGAGGKGVPTRLGQEVGPNGFVLATDIDVKWAETATGSNVSVVQHDVVHDAPPDGPFDLVHARLVLVHLPEREAVLQKLVSVLRPGGWLLIEDADPALQPLACPEEVTPEEILANKIRRGFRQLMKDPGVDLAYGRKLPRLFRGSGLQNVKAEGFFPLTAPACNALEGATIRLLRQQLIGKNLASPEEIETTLENLATGRIEVTTAPMISARGQRQF